jgi:RES domain-containing protein
MVSPSKSFTRAYRIVSRKYPPFDRSGTHRWGSRWNNPGRWVVHAPETYALALLESLAHWQTRILPPTLVCVEVEIPDQIEHQQLHQAEMPAPAENDYSAYRAVGDDWYDRGDTAVFWVRSMVSPYESNVLLNQRHKDFEL